MIKTVYAHEQWAVDGRRPSLALIGHRPLEPGHFNFWPKAIDILTGLRFKSTVYIPLHRGEEWRDNYDDIDVWVTEILEQVTWIAYWAEPELEDLERDPHSVNHFRGYARTGKMTLGHPNDTPKTSSVLLINDKRFKLHVHKTLTGTLTKAVLSAVALTTAT